MRVHLSFPRNGKHIGENSMKDSGLSGEPGRTDLNLRIWVSRLPRFYVAQSILRYWKVWVTRMCDKLKMPKPSSPQTWNATFICEKGLYRYELKYKIMLSHTGGPSVWSFVLAKDRDRKIPVTSRKGDRDTRLSKDWLMLALKTWVRQPQVTDGRQPREAVSLGPAHTSICAPGHRSPSPTSSSTKEGVYFCQFKSLGFY